MLGDANFHVYIVPIYLALQEVFFLLQSPEEVEEELAVLSNLIINKVVHPTCLLITTRIGEGFPPIVTLSLVGQDMISDF